MSSPVYYKVLSRDGRAFHGGTGSWGLPNGEPGAWKTVKGRLVPCVLGLHVCTRDQLVHWLGPAIFTVEVDDELINAGDKTIVRKARLLGRCDNWTDRTARLFAADCAERALRRVQKRTGVKTDPRSLAAVRAAREFAAGNISAGELSAARAAAWATAGAAAGAAAAAAAADAAAVAAWAAACAADAAADADAVADAVAAWAAVADADAAGAADAAAVRAAERRWQTRRLFEYIDGKRGRQA